MSIRARSRHLIPTSAAIGLSLLLAALSGTASGAGTYPTLYVNYTMGCNFMLTDDSGKAVSSIAPGNYQVLVVTPVAFGNVDLSGVNGMMACQGSAHFQLTGPGVALSTTLGDGSADHAMLQGAFQPSGTYVAQDMTPGSSAKITFTTTATSASTAPVAPASGSGASTGQATTTTTVTAPASTGDLPLRGALTATLTAGGKVALSSTGKPVGSLRAGKYGITIVDRSRTSGFVLQKLHRSSTALTTAAFTGRKTLTVTLTKGSWVFYPSSTSTISAFTVTA
jgi:hypothetical protein